VAATGRANSDSNPMITEADLVSIIEQVDAERVEQLVDEDTLTDVAVPDVTFANVGGHEQAKQQT